MKSMRLGVILDTQTRTGRFFRTLLTSFIHLGAATLYSFFLIPLVLHFESPEMLGLWLLVAQIGAYLTVVDAGLSALSIRQFVGPVSERDFRRLAPRFQATVLLSAIQGLCICLLGFTGSWWASIFKISGSIETLFVQLFMAQCFLVGISFPIRPFSSILLAAQRFEANYLASSASFGVALLLTWGGFHMGWGLWSVLSGGLFQIVASSLTSLWGVQRLGGLAPLLSRTTGVKSLIPSLIKESMGFASSPIFSTLAGLLQSTVLSRLFGLEGVALWNVGAKIATVLSQVLSKFFESSFGGLSELAEKGLGSQMRTRFLTLWSSTSGISLLLAVCLIWGNSPFIDWWTRGAMVWPIQATWGVALWLVTTTVTKGVAEQIKVLLLWRQIRWGPLLDFLALAAFVSTVFLSPRLQIYALALALAPLSGSFVWNARSLHLGMRAKKP
jgi:O-antigen/teichoic acid export membrane protein